MQRTTIAAIFGRCTKPPTLFGAEEEAMVTERVGLALVAALKGYRTIFTIPDKMSEEKINLLRAYGAKVIVCPTAAVAS